MIGGVAVIVTLIYLAVQLRQYAMGMNSATLHSTMQGFNQLNSMLATDAALADTLSRGLTDPDSLSPAEQHQFIWIARCYVNVYENLYQRFMRGACPEEYWVRYARELQQTLASPGGRRWRQANTTYEALYGYIDGMSPSTKPAYEMMFAPSQHAE